MTAVGTCQWYYVSVDVVLVGVFLLCSQVCTGVYKVTEVCTAFVKVGQDYSGICTGESNMYKQCFTLLKCVQVFILVSQTGIDDLSVNSNVYGCLFW